MKNILLLIDVQQGFIVKGNNDTIVNNIDNLIDSGIFDCIISTVYKNTPDNVIIKLMGWDKMMDKDEQSVVGQATLHSNHFVEKNQYSAYTEQVLDILKTENDGILPENIFIAGFDTECCVLKTAVDFFEAGIRPIVLSHYCGASSGEDAHAAGIRSLESLIGKNNMFNGLLNTKEDVEKLIIKAQKSQYQTLSSNFSKANSIINLLMEKGWHIAFAESCTGGMATAGIVDISNASKVLDASFVTYANDAKEKYVGVSHETIIEHGVVSEQVAAQMAKGAAISANANIGVGISGIAGPNGGTATKKVGMVCFGFYVNGKVITYTKQFGNIGRLAVRQSSVTFVYDTLISILQSQGI